MFADGFYPGPNQWANHRAPKHEGDIEAGTGTSEESGIGRSPGTNRGDARERIAETPGSSRWRATFMGTRPVGWRMAEEADEETEYDCNVCGRSFESREAAEAHLRDMGLLY